MSKSRKSAASALPTSATKRLKIRINEVLTCITINKYEKLRNCDDKLYQFALVSNTLQLLFDADYFQINVFVHTPITPL